MHFHFNDSSCLHRQHHSSCFTWNTPVNWTQSIFVHLRSVFLFFTVIVYWVLHDSKCRWPTLSPAPECLLCRHIWSTWPTAVHTILLVSEGLLSSSVWSFQVLYISPTVTFRLQCSVHLQLLSFSWTLAQCPNHVFVCASSSLSESFKAGSLSPVQYFYLPRCLLNIHLVLK